MELDINVHIDIINILLCSLLPLYPEDISRILKEQFVVDILDALEELEYLNIIELTSNGYLLNRDFLLRASASYLRKIISNELNSILCSCAG